MGDVGEWPRVHEDGGALKGLHQVGPDGRKLSKENLVRKKTKVFFLKKVKFFVGRGINSISNLGGWGQIPDRIHSVHSTHGTLISLLLAFPI